MAQELLALLAQRTWTTPGRGGWPNSSRPPGAPAPAEVRALWALAFKSESRRKHQNQGAGRLADGPPGGLSLVARQGHRPGRPGDMRVGPALAELSGRRLQLAVFVNDVRAGLLELTPEAATQTVAVPVALLKPGRQRINFQITGRGQYTYQCILSGFVAADKLQSTTRQWHVTRKYQPAPLEIDGREIPRGFDVLEGSYTTFANPLTALPVGRRGEVELELWPSADGPRSPASTLEYLVVTEPIPSGAAVIEKSVRGGFEHFEIGPGAITFFVGNRPTWPPSITSCTAICRASTGRHHHGPRRLSPRIAAGREPAEPLAVLPQGTASSDAYRLTPASCWSWAGTTRPPATCPRPSSTLPSWWGARMEPAGRRVSGGGQAAAGRPPGNRPAGPHRALLRDHQGTLALRGDFLAKILRVGGNTTTRWASTRAELPRVSGHGRKQLRTRKRRGRLPGEPGRVSAERGRDGPAAASIRPNRTSPRPTTAWPSGCMPRPPRPRPTTGCGRPRSTAWPWCGAGGCWRAS